ncbi:MULTISPECIES: TIM barrel protein [unclassified Beijerinckia]|uniref:hydroxypyruvate isomerase family protein n=1 Tax=unclassified Beijerinckia TaxID=2638183 RepID=UPI00089497BA|nr:MULTISPECIES: TIM barrel protein [unclassified Beijerinckia]MDH7798709.1 hydroxypyruvate isomerase [Beijerinckia sp. GAS462]SED30341.1 hydroxypyruvate isomerase [Beijerinckia sp. 28-YEA-48]
MLRFDANLRWLFTELPMLQRYEAAAKAGFQGVEVAFPYDYPAREVAARLRDNGLTLVQILSPFDWNAGERGLAALPGRADDFKAGFRNAHEYAGELGDPFIHVMPGNIGPQLDRARCMDQFLENLAWAADQAPQLTLILEPCCRARFPEFLYHRLDEGIAVLQQLGRSNVKLCYDTFHVQMEEGDLADRLRAAWPYIGHIQVGNVPGRHEPGTGEIHFPFLFKLMEELGWQGWVGCEYTPSAHTLDTLTWGAPFGLGMAAAKEAATC